MNQADKILQQFNQFDSRLLTELERILGANPTRDEFILFVNEKDIKTGLSGLDELIDELGVEGIVNAFMDEYNEIAFNQVNRLKKSLISSEVERISQIVEYEGQINRRTILGYFDVNAQKLKHELNKSIIAGQTSQQTIKELRNQFIRESDQTTHILTDANVSTVVGTAYNDISRSVTKAAFEDNPDQRFRYEGTTVPTSSPICEWVKENQPKEGYTIDEINKGIQVPPNQPTKLGRDTGKGGVVNWNGRVPNYNCDDSWMPVE